MRLLAFLLLVLTAAAPSPRGPDRVLRTETVAGRFVGWEFGDYLWAQVEVAGRERTGMWIGRDPIGPFLEAHRGRTLTLTVQTISVYIPEASGRSEMPRITGARLGRLTAHAWWRGLTPAGRRAARARFERAI